jgi:hypothetical protein
LSFHIKKEINESENGLSKSTRGADKNSIFYDIGISLKGAYQEIVSFFFIFEHQTAFTAILRGKFLV